MPGKMKNTNYIVNYGKPHTRYEPGEVIKHSKTVKTKKKALELIKQSENRPFDDTVTSVDHLGYSVFDFENGWMGLP